MIEMRVLGSGSTGNCTLVRAGAGSGRRLIMIDAGLGPRTVARRLGADAAELDHLDAVLLTHLDRDHFNPAWLAVLAHRNVTLYCHQKHLYGLYRHEPTTREGIDARVLHRRGLLRPFTDEPFDLEPPHTDRLPLDGQTHQPEKVHVRPLPLAHDRSGVFGFDVHAGPTRLGFATDLGRVPGRLIDAFCNVDLLAIESNYHPPMQIESARPAGLKRRIMGGSGHLSNEQALQAVRQIIAASQRTPAHIVLLHLSRQCNCPTVIQQLYARHPDLAARLCLTHHQQPTAWLAAKGRGHTPAPPRSPAYQQMTMF